MAGVGPRWVDIAARAYRSIAARPGKSLATSVGVVLAVASMVAITLISLSAASAIQYEFDRNRATEITVDIPASIQPVVARTDRVTALAGRQGVVAAGMVARSSTEIVLQRSDRGRSFQGDLIGLTDGAAEALLLRVVSGRAIFPTPPTNRIAVAGVGLWNQLGMRGQPVPPEGLTIHAGRNLLTIVGVVVTDDATALLGGSLFVPREIAHTLSNGPLADQLVVRTDIGATATVAADLPLLIWPEKPEIIRAVYTPVVGTTQHRVSTQTNALTYASAAVLMVVGLLSIGSAIMASVRNRWGEIGLMRAIGARRTTIASQFLWEGGFIGLAGGVIGAVLGFNIAAVVALGNAWQLVLSWPVITLGAPAGLVVGLLGAARPAAVASNVLPATALRQ